MNEKLLAMDVKFMDGKSGPKNYDAVGSGDVVILPAFGATIQEMQLLDEKYHLYSIHTCTYTYTIVYFPRNAFAHAVPIVDWRRKVQIVDTTCPWVSKVWNAVDSHRAKGQTR